MIKYLSVSLLGVIILLVTLAPFITSNDPMQTDQSVLSLPPLQSWTHPLGTDRFGRDVLSRALYGGQHTLAVAAAAALLAVVGGLLLGLCSELGTIMEQATTALTNTLLAIPGLLVAFVIVTLVGQGTSALLLAVGIAQIAPYARVVQGAAISIQNEVYVEAAQALGASRRRIILHHILPNITTTLLAYACVVLSYCILNSAALSFLGLGTAPGTPDWGVMLADGRAGFRTVWWVSLVPGILITATVWVVNNLSDMLSD